MHALINQTLRYTFVASYHENLTTMTLLGWDHNRTAILLQATDILSRKKVIVQKVMPMMVACAVE